MLTNFPLAEVSSFLKNNKSTLCVKRDAKMFSVQLNSSIKGGSGIRNHEPCPVIISRNMNQEYVKLLLNESRITENVSTDSSRISEFKKLRIMNNE